MDSSQILKFVVRLIIAMVWIIILPVLYVNTRRKYTCYSIRRDSVLGDWCYSSYMVAVVVYLMGNAVDVILFFVPPIGRYIETSNDRICAFLSWWTQVGLFCYQLQCMVYIFHFLNLSKKYKMKQLTSSFVGDPVQNAQLWSWFEFLLMQWVGLGTHYFFLEQCYSKILDQVFGHN